MKTCKDCKQAKAKTLFYKHKSHSDGLSSYCKKCACVRVRLYQRTKEGFIVKVYAHQKHRSKEYEMSPPAYTKAELTAWFFEQSLYHDLFSAWVAASYCTKLSPSVDRIDDYKPYTFDNIQLMTWGENHAKGASDRLNGINNKVSTGVKQLTLTGELVAEFYSQRAASRATKIIRRSISRCCNGLSKSAGGFDWSYI